MAAFYKKIRGFGARVIARARDFKVPGIGLHVMTSAALDERLEAARRDERSKSNRLVSNLVHETVMQGAQITVMKQKIRKHR